MVGCYDLHLYCDGVNCSNGDMGYRAEFEYTHEHGSTARRTARVRGWKLLRSGHCLCPKCDMRGAMVTEEPA
jgi:hypothetical protein